MGSFKDLLNSVICKYEHCLLILWWLFKNPACANWWITYTIALNVRVVCFHTCTYDCFYFSLIYIYELVEGDYFWTILAFPLGGRFTTRVLLHGFLVYVSEFLQHFLIEWL
jgi:hypothetical protein